MDGEPLANDALPQEVSAAQATGRRAASANSPEEALSYLSQALDLDPDYPGSRRLMQEALDRQLAQDGFIRYVDETDAAYHVHLVGQLPLTVPKQRAVPNPYPPAGARPLEPAYRWLRIALLGLLPAGLGSVICAALAALHASRARKRAANPVDRARAEVVLGIALLLEAVSMLLTILFLMHILF